VAVPDAEVIPLGTRGKPGRGTGSTKPSSAARTLAGSAALPRKKAVPPRRETEPADVPPEDAATEPEPTESPEGTSNMICERIGLARGL
jgi:hypothetical protein